jgi:hypothetical protein
MTMTYTSSSSTTAVSPVDDVTYNLLQSLVTKLEGIETFTKYAADGGEWTDLYDRLARENADSAKELLSALRKQLAS